MATTTKGLINSSDMALYNGVDATVSRINSTGGTETGIPIGDGPVNILAVYGASATATNDTTITTALNKLGANNRSILLSPGTWSITDDVTIPKNIVTILAPGVTISVDSGKTFAPQGPVVNFNPATIFSGDGTVGGWFNFVMGPEAGAALTAPDIEGKNTLIGYQAGKSLTAARNCTFIGYRSGAAFTTFTGGLGGNTGLGATSLTKLTTGYQNTALGDNTLAENLTGNFNTAGGWGALGNCTLDNNTAFGINALNAASNVRDSAAFGMFALTNVNYSDRNTAIGFNTANNFGDTGTGFGAANGSGDGNTWLGAQAGLGAQKGDRNTVLGSAAQSHGATRDFTGDDNTFVGYKAADLKIIDGDQNTILGAYSDVPVLVSGTTTTTTTDKLIASAGHFNTNVKVNDIVKNTSDTEATGNHDGSSGASTLTDSGESWTVNEFLGRVIHNTTDRSFGTITANDATTITATLAGGTDNDWDASDGYTIKVGRAAVSSVDSNTQLTLDKDIMLTGENYEIVDENDSVVLAAGGATGSSATRFYSPSDGSASIGQLGSSGRLYKNLSESVTTAGANSSFVIQVNIPSGAKILGCQLKVDTALASGETWSAAYSGGASQTIAATGQVITAGHIVDAFFDTNAATDIASSEVDVTITRDAGNFSSTGTIRAIVHYEAFKSMS